VAICGEGGQLPRVVHVVVPGADDGALTVAATVADGVHRVHGVAVPRQPAAERVVQAEVLAVAVQQDDDPADVAVRQPCVVVDEALGPGEGGAGGGHEGSSRSR
jgi:hypothetical protein